MNKEEVKTYLIEHKTEIFTLLGFISAVLVFLKDYIMLYVPSQYVGIAALIFMAAAFISSKKDFKAWATMAVKYEAVIDAGQAAIAAVCDATGKSELDDEVQQKIDEFQEVASEIVKTDEPATTET